MEQLLRYKLTYETDLLLDLCELAGNVSGVTVQDGGVAVGNLTGVVQHDHLQ